MTEGCVGNTQRKMAGRSAALEAAGCCVGSILAWISMDFLWDSGGVSHWEELRVCHGSALSLDEVCYKSLWQGLANNSVETETRGPGRVSNQDLPPFGRCLLPILRKVFMRLGDT